MHWIQVNIRTRRTDHILSILIRFHLIASLPFRHHYDIICDQTGTIRRLYEVDLAKRNQAQLTAAIELCDGLETEILLCYNRKFLYIAVF